MTRANIAPFGWLNMPVLVLTGVFGPAYWLLDLFAIQHGMVINDYLLVGRDFVNMWYGGGLAAAGHGETVYDIDAYRQSLWTVLHLKGIYAYPYPPHSLFLAMPFSLLPYGWALLAWNVLGVALFVHAAAPWLRDVRLPVWYAAVLPAGFVNIWLSHNGFVTGALALYGWRLLDTAPGRSGLAFAALTIKPHLGLLVLPILLFRREWRAIAAAAAGTVALALLAASAFGWTLWPIYVSHTLLNQADMFDAPSMGFQRMMPTTMIAALASGLPRGIATLAQAATALYAIAVVARCAAARVCVRDLGLLTTTAILLILPYAFIYDMTAHCLATLVFAARAGGRGAGWQRAILAAGFVLPLLQLPLALANLPLGPLILLPVLWVQSRIVLAGAGSASIGRDGPAGAAAAH